MVRGLRPAGPLALLLSAVLAGGCGLINPTPDEPPEPAEGPQAQPPAPRHEVFAAALAAPSAHVFTVPCPPPSPLPELPPEAKPAGADVVWVPGYWAWDAGRDDWVWVTGAWVHAPPGRHWSPGYWAPFADGWRWVHGFWAADPPPPPPAPPPGWAYGQGAGWYDGPGYAFFPGGFFGGYGMGWPWYRPRHHHALLQAAGPPPLLPSAHVPAPAVASHVPHAAETLSFLARPLASGVHAPPSPGAATAPDVLPPPASVPPRVDMASVFASLPQPVASSLGAAKTPEWHPGPSLPGLPSSPGGHGASGIPGLLHDPAGRMTSLFLNAHLGTALHEPMSLHAESSSRFSGGGRESAGGSHSSAGHGGGHGR